MKNELKIIGLKVNARIGVHAWEQRIWQPLLIDLMFPYDASGLDDNIDNALDYDQITKHVLSILENQSFYLIETVAERVGTSLCETLHCREITVTVGKPHAIAEANLVSVTLTTRREE